MSTFEVLKMAIASLSANRVRSLLTALSITIGAFAIVVMSSLAESGLNTLKFGIEDLGGAQIVFLFPKSPERGQEKQSAYATGISVADRDRIAADLPHIAGLTLYSSLGSHQVQSATGVTTTASEIAADASFFAAFKMKIARGRAFTEEENHDHAHVCLIGPELAEVVGPTPAEALGGMLTVGELHCRIIGVLANNERFIHFGFKWNNIVVAPHETLADYEPATLEGSTVFIKTDAASSNDIVKRMINAQMSARHPGVDDFAIIDFSRSMESFRGVFAAMAMIVAVLAGIALVVGGVGVMNMMLVAVSERVREIGVRKALGAPPRLIGAQFLTEAVLLSTLGGASGVGLGLLTAIGASALISRAFTNWQTSLAPWAAVSSLLVTCVIGVAFGWLPAKRASALDPVEAMRR